MSHSLTHAKDGHEHPPSCSRIPLLFAYSLIPRGNFKMNGSVKMIDSLVEQLNDAKLDGSTGE